MTVPIFDFGRAIALANDIAFRSGIKQRVRVCPCQPDSLHFVVVPVDRVPESVMR